MYIDEVDCRAVFIDTFNWLCYLSYDSINISLSGCGLFVQGSSYGQTVT